MVSMAATISTLRRLKIYFPCSLDMLMNLRLNFTLNWVLFIQFQRLILNHFLPGISKALSYKWNTVSKVSSENQFFFFLSCFILKQLFPLSMKASHYQSDSNLSVMAPWPLMLWLVMDRVLPVWPMCWRKTLAGYVLLCQGPPRWDGVVSDC